MIYILVICFYRASEVKVYAGSVTIEPLDADAQERVASQIIVHHLYNPSSLNNDISLIRLNHPLVFSHVIWPVPLPGNYEAEQSLEGMFAVASGWGKTSNADPGVTNKLRYVDLRIANQESCERSYLPGSVTDGNICVDTDFGTRSTCNGDSGGPLVLSTGGALVGVTSFGPIVGCTTGLPAAFTRVTFYLQWIKSFTGL